jgi:hypothetical protein
MRLAPLLLGLTGLFGLTGLVGCDPVMDGNIYVEVSATAQRQWTEEAPGTVHLRLDSDDEMFEGYSSFRLCEAAAEARVMNYSFGGVGCARPVTAFAWITPTVIGDDEEDFSCSEWTYHTGDAPVAPSDAESDVIFADRDDKCPSGEHDEITLSL